MASTFLTAEWRKLAIANYAVDPSLLLPFLPYKTELDLWNGTCYVSLVGFRFINTRLKGLPIPFHRHFEEVNLRFYVRYKDASGWKRGVTFISEIVPKAALSFVANTIYNEKYKTLRMRHAWDIGKEIVKVSYHWRQRRQWNDFSVTADAPAVAIAEGSAEEFITEHYWGYSKIGNFKTNEYGVEHPRWEMYPVRSYQIDVAFESLYGSRFAGLKEQEPDSVMLAEGSSIVVRSGSRIR